MIPSLLAAAANGPMLLAVAESDAPAEPTSVGVGAVVLMVIASAVLIWMGYLVISSRRGPSAPEETPKNLQPYLSDDELENNRITRVLGAAVIAAAVLAVVLPVYYVNESSRQQAAAGAFEEKDIEEGSHWYVKFSCVNCHGPDGGGGGGPFIERRSGVDTSWTAPSINDVFYRYSEDEVRYWVVHGRSGTPMPAAGLEGGGSMTVQEVDQLLAYLHSIQIPQGDVLGEIEGTVTQALARITNGIDSINAKIAEQEAAREDILMAPQWFAVIEPLTVAVDQTLANAGSCTARSAAIVGTSCDSPGVDTDRDGLSDAAELELTRIAEALLEGVPTRNPATLEFEPNEEFDFAFDPENAFTNQTAGGDPEPDLAAVEIFRNHVDTRELNLRVATERQDRFLATVEEGLSFLLDARDAEHWVPEGIEVAETETANPDDPDNPTVERTLDATGLARAMGVSEDEALRAVGLFNGYCARCHTGGYAAGVAFQQPAGSGAWAPGLRDGRSLVQFPDAADQIDFVIKGSEEGTNYGVNGLGRGWMPGFGQILSQEDIELIVAYERALP